MNDNKSITLLDLPLDQKQLIYSQVAIFAAASEALGKITQFDRDTVMGIVYRHLMTMNTNPTEAEIDTVLIGLLVAQKKERETGNCTRKIQSIAQNLQTQN